MIIQLLTASDAPAFWDLRLRGLQESPESFGSSYEEESATPLEKQVARFQNDMIVPAEENFILGAFDENSNLVGVVGFRREHRLKTRHKGTVWGMYVAPEQRGKGVGRQLLSEVLAKARLLPGLRQVNLGVMNANESAKALYRSVGFHTYGTEKDAFKIGEQFYDDDLMELFL